MLKRRIIWLLLLTVLVAGLAYAGMSVTPGGGGGSVPSYGAVQTALLTAPSGTYTTPAGAVWLVVCQYGAGGGGGAATSGGATPLSGGGGGAGAEICSQYYGSLLLPSYPYTNGTGGTAGTCSATPTAAGNGSAGTWGTGAAQLSINFGSGGGTATTVAAGSGGSGGGVSGQANGPYQLISNLTGFNGHIGLADQVVYGGNGAGAIGGQSWSVTSGGVCHFAATNGANGYITVTAYFN